MIEEILNRLVLQELGLQLLTRLRVQAQAEDLQARLTVAESRLEVVVDLKAKLDAELLRLATPTPTPKRTK